MEQRGTMPKRHGWLTEALQDAGYSQHDLALAWKVDDAVVSRFISSGKPDLTPERQMLLSQILGLTNDELLNKLYGDTAFKRVLPLTRQQQRDQNSPQPRVTVRQLDGGGIEEAHAELKRAIEHLQEVMPHATVTVTITYRGQ
jgi:hypothetical protein